MNTAISLSSRLREVFLDGKWIANTNYKEQLSEIGFDVATTQVYDLNTIALLTFHINYYVKGIVDAMKSGKLEIHDKYSFQLPPLQNESEWLDLKNALFQNATELIERIAALSPEDLEKDFFNPKYGTYQRNIDGILEHSYYHLGQIVLIRKLLNAINE